MKGWASIAVAAILAFLALVLIFEFLAGRFRRTPDEQADDRPYSPARRRTDNPFERGRR